MKTQKIILIIGCMLVPTISGAATSCSRMNLNRCLDSVCAINIGANPAARCQYCGSADAGAPTASKMRSVSTGNTKYTLSEKELRAAPDDPGERYAWGAAECLKRVSGCTVDDIEESYDTLIEQSCQAAGISAQFKKLAADARKKKSKSACESDIRACVIADGRCGATYGSCKEDAVFDRYFSACSVEVGIGCDEYTAAIRQTLATTRETTYANAANVVEQIVAAYKNARENKLAAVQNSCKTSEGRTACEKTVCQRNMPNKCAIGYEQESAMARQLCLFYDRACELVD